MSEPNSNLPQLDLAQELRSHDGDYNLAWGCRHSEKCVRCRAADEIERLQTAREALSIQVDELCEQSNYERGEIGRLRKWLDTVRDTIDFAKAQGVLNEVTYDVLRKAATDGF